MSFSVNDGIYGQQRCASRVAIVRMGDTVLEGAVNDVELKQPFVVLPLVISGILNHI